MFSKYSQTSVPKYNYCIKVTKESNFESRCYLKVTIERVEAIQKLDIISISIQTSVPSYNCYIKVTVELLSYRITI